MSCLITQCVSQFIFQLEDKVEELLHGKDQSNEKDLQILKWKLQAKEKEAAALKLSDEQRTEEGDEKNLQTLENNSPNHVVSNICKFNLPKL